MCVSALNYQTHINNEALSDLSKIILSITSGSLKFCTDFTVYWIGIRGLKVIFSEYEYRQTVTPLSKGKEG